MTASKFAKSQARFQDIAICLGLALLAVLIHGYHLGTDDAGIWVPAIKQAANPALYPFGSEFFNNHARLSVFPFLLGSLARWSRLPVDAVIFACDFLSVFLLLFASLMLLRTCFENARAHWAGVALLAAVLSAPVAGTALPIMDPYVTSRTLSTPLALFAVACYLLGQRTRALAWLAACFLIHPQMSIYAAVLLSLMEWAPSGRRALPVLLSGLPLGWLPLGWDFAPARGAAREALLSRTYFFVTKWAWYEWLGVAAPLALLWYWSRAPLRGARAPLNGLLRNLIWFGLLFTAAGLFLVSSPRLENFTRLQPMRAFHLVYILFFLILGALTGEYVLKQWRWRWFALFAPLAAGMWIMAWQSYPSSPHVEWPGVAPRGEWALAFAWVRYHTPLDAVFAMDPNYLLLPGEDMHGFRAVAERSVLADRVKDSGAVSLFPQLGPSWDRQWHAQNGWDSFSLADFIKLAGDYPVSWIVTRKPVEGLDCPYRSTGLSVCRISPDRIR